jgi:hypothetical protein
MDLRKTIAHLRSVLDDLDRAISTLKRSASAKARSRCVPRGNLRRKAGR